MSSRTSALLGLAVIVILIALGWYFFSPAPQAAEAPQIPVASSTPVEAETWNPLESVREAVVSAVSGTKSYTNEAFHYSFSYPSSWVLEPETSEVNIIHQMPSIVSVHEAKEDSPRRFSVTINRTERTLKDHAPKTEAITVGGVAATAYIFPDGYECKDDPDCSFFLIPILQGDVWYEITAANDAATLDAYRTILASFKFTE